MIEALMLLLLGGIIILTVVAVVYAFYTIYEFIMNTEFSGTIDEEDNDI